MDGSKVNLRKIGINEKIPNGWRVLQLEEAKYLKSEINSLMGNDSWFIVAFATGKLDGKGYGNNFSETCGDECGNIIIGECEVNEMMGPASIAPLKNFKR